MAEFRKIVMGMPSISYESKSTGTRYPFWQHKPTKIEVCGSPEQKENIKKDVEYFRNNPEFEEITASKKIKEKVIKTKEKVEKKASKEPSYNDKLIALKSIDDELADIIMLKYKTWESFLANTNLLDLRSISGIGNKRAKSIMSQIEAITSEDIRE